MKNNLNVLAVKDITVGCVKRISNLVSTGKTGHGMLSLTDSGIILILGKNSKNDNVVRYHISNDKLQQGDRAALASALRVIKM